MSTVVLKFEQLSERISHRISVLRQLISEEMKLPDFKGRHLFTARLRIVLFLATWMVFFVFFPTIWKVAPFVPLIFNVCFLCTTLCHLHVMRFNRILISVMLLEIFADVISQTMIIYIMGMETWAPYMIYCLYVTAAGILSGYNAAIMASVIVLVCYNVLFYLVQQGVLPQMKLPEFAFGQVDYDHLRPYINLIFLPISLIIIVYSVRIANFFSRIKESALERRNVQLTALNHIGATIRHMLKVNKVIDEVLKAVIQGLGFDVCVLALVDPVKQTVKFFVPEGNYYTKRMEEILGQKFHLMNLPFGVHNNSAYMAIKRNRIIIRNNLSELIHGIEPHIPMRNSLRAQKVLGLRKFVITPLVAEQKVVGAIIGASKKNYIEESIIDTLDNFANQAALAIESSQLIDALEIKNKELIKADKMKSEFLAIMSHELRTPLNAVLGYTESLADQSLGPVNEDQKKSLYEVLKNGRNLLELINSLLDLAKIESGKMELDLNRFDLGEMVADIRSSLQSLIDKKQQVFSLHAQAQMPAIEADAVKMRQILTNLIGNAIKFTGVAGEVDIFIEYYENCEDLCQNDFVSERPPVEVERAPGFLLRIRDTGIGIQERDLQNIFELFKQADSSFTRRHEGTGLGLALTKQLVLLHSGYIVVKSEYGHGTEFKILFPQFQVRES